MWGYELHTTQLISSVASRPQCNRYCKWCDLLVHVNEFLEWYHTVESYHKCIITAILYSAQSRQPTQKHSTPNTVKQYRVTYCTQILPSISQNIWEKSSFAIVQEKRTFTKQANSTILTNYLSLTVLTEHTWLSRTGYRWWIRHLKTLHSRNISKQAYVASIKPLLAVFRLKVDPDQEETWGQASS